MNELDEVHQRFAEAMSRIAQFWGFPRGMGAVYGALYLSSAPLSLDELVTLTNVTKGAVSTHVRALSRLQMVQKHVELGDRKDYYVAETRLWRVVQNVLRQRRESDFDQALSAVKELLASTKRLNVPRGEGARMALVVARLESMQSFFSTLDAVVGALLTLDELGIGAAQRVISNTLRPNPSKKRRP